MIERTSVAPRERPKSMMAPAKPVSAALGLPVPAVRKRPGNSNTPVGGAPAASQTGKTSKIIFQHGRSWNCGLG